LYSPRADTRSAPTSPHKEVSEDDVEMVGRSLHPHEASHGMY